MRYFWPTMTRAISRRSGRCPFGGGIRCDDHRMYGIAEGFVGIGIDAGVVDHKHAGIFESPADKAGEIEHRMPFARRRQEVE